MRVAALSSSSLLNDETQRLDRALNVLSPKEAELYRALFEAQSRSDWDSADYWIRRVTDKHLMGSVLADRYLRRGASLHELTSWLKLYAALPEADDVYAMALKAGGKHLPKPTVPAQWTGGSEVDGAVNFSPALKNNKQALSSKSAQKEASVIWNALNRNDPWAADKALTHAVSSSALPNDFTADVQASVAAAYFRLGERDRATALSLAAARAKRPLGLWIRGLIAWEQKDYPAARVLFGALSTDASLISSNKSAAHFWAYRAENKGGSASTARKHLEIAASEPRTLYGLLAGQLLERSPVAALFHKKTRAPVWNAHHRTVLAQYPEGWRAMALIQVGQPEKAAAELLRLNPKGDGEKQEAMQALVAFVPMPALALQLAQTKPEHGFDPSLYPLPPWQPAGGFKVDRALLFALARHESLFDPTAVSTRGARGLMQIMPATAASIMRTDGGVKNEDLLDPSFSMTLGQKYVHTLSQTPGIGNNLLLLLAAYNGGPAKALNWSSRMKDADPLLFMESIPQRETRRYVARVLPHYWAYSARLGKPSPTLRQMAEGRWPTASLAETGVLRFADAGK